MWVQKYQVVCDVWCWKERLFARKVVLKRGYGHFKITCFSNLGWCRGFRDTLGCVGMFEWTVDLGFWEIIVQ